MKYTYILLLVAAIACQEKHKPTAPTVAGNFDSVELRALTSWPKMYKIGDPVPPAHRYFLVAYTTLLKTGATLYDQGERWFRTDGGFFTKKEFDDSVYADLPLKRNCYQHIIITHIYEFKDSVDFEDFDRNYIGDKNPKKQKACSCPGCARIVGPRIIGPTDPDDWHRITGDDSLRHGENYFKNVGSGDSDSTSFKTFIWSGAGPAWKKDSPLVTQPCDTVCPKKQKS